MLGKLLGLVTGGGGSMWLIIAAVVAIGGYIGVLKWDNAKLVDKVEDLRVELKQAQLDIEIEKGNVRTCQARVDGANDRLEDLKDVNDDRKKIIDMLGENIDTFREASDARIDNIRDAVVGKSCEEAMQFLREGINDFRR